MFDEDTSGGVDRRRFLRGTALGVSAGAVLPLLGACGGTAARRSGGGRAADASLARGSTSASPDELFRDGKFGDAERGYRTQLLANPNDAHAAAQLGYIALLSNRFRDAEKYLTQAVHLVPGDVFSLRQLADCFVRQDLFSRATAPLRATGDANDAATAELYAHVSGTPWQVRGPASTRVPLLTLDPLPQLDLSVNGTTPKPVVVDTGATTVDCSMELAHQAGLQAISSSTAILGGRPTTIYLGIAESVRVGNIEVRNLPVQWHDAPPLGDTQGVIGTTFFYHFRTTIDYANRQFGLRRKTQRAFGTGGRNMLPLWLANGHIPVTLGSLNDYGPRPVTMDTGGIGHGVDTSVATAQQAGIAVDLSHPIPGPGPVGYPISPDRISLGTAVGRHIPGIANQELATGSGMKFDVIANFTNDFFQPFAITLDFTAMNVSI